MRRIRLVAVDLDGTLLNSDFELTPGAKEAISRARRIGVEITLCTGRMFASARRYADKLGLDLPLITYQGAFVKTSKSGKILYQRCVPLEYAREVISEGQSRKMTANVYLNDNLYVEKITPQARDYARMARVNARAVGDLLKFVKEPPIKVLLIGDETELQKLEKRLKRKYRGELYITRSMPYYLEFLHPEATKGLGLQEVAREIGVAKDEIMAIGDSWNDIEMFRYAGFAVAMGNACEEVKTLADYITAPNYEGGVAEALQKLVLKS